MQIYQKQYGGRSVCHLVYHRVEESWYRELSQICHSACATYAYAYVLVTTRLFRAGMLKNHIYKFYSSAPHSFYDNLCCSWSSFGSYFPSLHDHPVTLATIKLNEVGELGWQDEDRIFFSNE